MKMLEVQLENFKKTPLLTNTQPDFSGVGNAAMLDRTVRSNNWIRSDTIFIENEQIEALSNRPAWTAALLEAPLPGKAVETTAAMEGISPIENELAHVIDVGANYCSLWNFHNIDPKVLASSYEQSRAAFDSINRRIGYRVRPSFVWSYADAAQTGLIIGFANDGIAAVPGVLRVTVEDGYGKALRSGCLDAGFPLPGKIRQAHFVLPHGTQWQGLKLRAELEVKGVRYPVRWACHQKVNDDSTLSLRANIRA
jgi:hypothetical protein